jgi:hypothetical protein
MILGDQVVCPSSIFPQKFCLIVQDSLISPSTSKK